MMMRIYLLVLVLINISFGLPTKSFKKHSIVFPTEAEDEERYRADKVINKEIKYKPVYFPKDDYDDKTEEVNNKLNFKTPIEENSFVKEKHTTEFHAKPFHTLHNHRTTSNGEPIHYSSAGSHKHTLEFHANRSDVRSAVLLTHDLQLQGKTTFKSSTNQTKPTPEFQENSSMQDNSHSIDAESQEGDITFDDRFLFKVVPNCKRRLRYGNCSRRAN